MIIIIIIIIIYYNCWWYKRTSCTLMPVRGVHVQVYITLVFTWQVANCLLAFSQKSYQQETFIVRVACIQHSLALHGA